MRTLSEVLANIADSISRKKGTFGLAPAPIVPGAPVSSTFVLSAGSCNAVRVPGGFLVSLGLTREQVQGLRDECDEAMGNDGSGKQTVP